MAGFNSGTTSPIMMGFFQLNEALQMNSIYIEIRNYIFIFDFRLILLDRINIVLPFLLSTFTYLFTIHLGLVLYSFLTLDNGESN